METTALNFVPPKPQFTNLYTLHYRSKNELLSKIFQFDGNLRKASDRGRSHCELMGYVFNYVKPFVSDLNFDEKRRLATFESVEREKEDPPFPGQPATAGG